MFFFILRRFLITIPLLFIASILVFVMVINLGMPQKLENAIAKPNASPAAIASIRAQFGLDEPPVQRYVHWITGFVRGDMGVDGDNVQVRSDIWRAMQVTIRLLLFAQIVAVVLGTTVGVISAIRQYTGFDYLSTGMAFFFFSIPT
ncbi:MAG TPA: ABC transporter permease, partial [Ilumatobacteraceae bacterium]